MILSGKYKSILGICAFPLLGYANPSGIEQSRPNILVVLCDDLGYCDVGFNGSPDIKTPELDRLANRGTIFTSAYVAHPFCGPSRASLMTGRYPQCIGTPYNLRDEGLETNDGVPVSETFMSNVLQDAGYFTAALGKWHLGDNSEFQPNQRGFDEFVHTSLTLPSAFALSHPASHASYAAEPL